MVKKVLKFGGTSVGTIERIQHVSNIIQKERSSGSKVIAIVSAMSGKTNELIKLSKGISEEFDKRDTACCSCLHDHPECNEQRIPLQHKRDTKNYMPQDNGMHHCGVS